MPSYYCLYCDQQTEHLNVRQAARMAQVTRATVYNWMNRALLHYVIRPSGRKFICVRSLIRPRVYEERTTAESRPRSLTHLPV